jgi:hypothetical protein
MTIESAIWSLFAVLALVGAIVGLAAFIETVRAGGKHY